MFSTVIFKRGTKSMSLDYTLFTKKKSETFFGGVTIGEFEFGLDVRWC